MTLAVLKVLVPTDLSPCSEAALDQGMALAERHGAELHFLHVMLSYAEDPYSLVYQVSDRSELYRQQRQLCAEKMRELCAARAERGVTVHQHLRQALAVPLAILETVEREGIDLVVIGAHGRRGLRRFLLGSVAEETVRQAPCPVITVREHRTFESLRLDRIVVPTDFSAGSTAALQTAKELMGESTRLDLVHVVEHPVYPQLYEPLHELAREYGFPQIVPKLQEGMAALAEKAGVECHCEVLAGKAAAEVTQYAASAGADLIVMATHGLTGLEHLLLGSVTEKVVRSSDSCPVLTLRAGAVPAEDS